MAKATTSKIDVESEKALHDAATAIARLQWDNWDVIQQYKWFQLEEQKLIAAVLKKYPNLTTDAAIRARAHAYVGQLSDLNAPRKVGGRPKQRMGPQQKLDVLLAMLRDFKRQKKDQVSLKDINAWLGEPRKQAEEDIRDQYGLRNSKITQTQWFAVKAGDEKIPLYQKQHYITRNAPHVSHFVVNAWLKWLEQNEEKLSKKIASKQRRGS